VRWIRNGVSNVRYWEEGNLGNIWWTKVRDRKGKQEGISERERTSERSEEGGGGERGGGEGG